MRTLTVLVAHPSPELYGSDRVMIETVQGLRRAGHRVLVTVPTTGPLVGQLTRLGVEVVVCPSPVLRKSFASPVGLLRLLVDVLRSAPRGWWLLARNRVDLVVVNTVTIPLWLFLAQLPPWRRRPSVCHVHEAERSAPRLVRRALGVPLLLADAVVINSNFSRQVLAEVYPGLAERAVVVANAVPGAPEVTPAREYPAPPVRLLFVGRLSPRKGPDVAVAALADLVSHGTRATLDLVGSVYPGYEWFERDLRALIAEHGLHDSVTFHGFDADVWPYLAACDVAIVPSTLDEPFGNTAVEAVLAARPAVVSATSGLLEAVQGYDCVVSVPPSDPGAIADAVRTIIADWATFRAAATDDAVTAAARHSTQRYGERITEIVESMQLGRS